MINYFGLGLDHSSKKIISMLTVLLLSFSLVAARSHHICSESNESVVKFRKNTIGHDPKEALKICIADKIVGKHAILFEWPVDLCDFWVSSLFGPRKLGGVQRMHEGVDLAASQGTAIKASAAGTVTRAETDVPGYGTLVEITHAKGFKTRYGHLHELMVQEGDKVESLEMIGTVGSTGRVRGKRDASHLHFEILHHGSKINPLKYLYCGEVAFNSK